MNFTEFPRVHAIVNIHGAAAFVMPTFPVFFFLCMWPGSLTVGMSGVSFRWLWIRELIAPDSIVSVDQFDEHRQRGVKLALSGRVLKLLVLVLVLDRELSAMIERRINDVRQLRGMTIARPLVVDTIGRLAAELHDSRK